MEDGPVEGAGPSGVRGMSQRQELIRWLLIAGLIGLAVGAFLPWVEADVAFVGSISRIGTDGDGKITLVLAIVIAILVGSGVVGSSLRLSRTRTVWALVLAVPAMAVAVYDFIDASKSVGDLNRGGLGVASVGSGMYLTVLGSIAVFGALVVLARGPRTTSSS